MGENLKCLSTKCKCNNCKDVFDINKQNIIFNKRFEDETGKSIFITYFDCPNCQERHYVQIDDAHTIEIRNKVQKMFVKFSSMRKKNIQISKQQQNKFNGLQNALKFSRHKLMKQYNSSLVTDTETGEVITLSFVIV